MKTKDLSYIFALLCSPLYWFEVAQRSKHLQAKVINNIERFRKPLIAFQVIFALFMIILGAILGFFNIVSIVMIPVIFAIGFTYIYLLAKLKSLFGSSTKDGDESNNNTNDSKGFKIINEFRTTSRFIVSGLMICGLFVALYGALTILYDWKEISKENMVSPLSVAVVLSRSGFIICNLGLAIYIHKRAAVIMEKSRVAAQARSIDLIRSELSTREMRVTTPSSMFQNESHN